MIVTAVFLFLLGTKIGGNNAIKSHVKYEPSRVAIREQIDQSSIIIPELGSPASLPSIVHQGSNYFFGAPFPMRPRFLPAPPAVEITEVKDKDCNDATFVSKPKIYDFVERGHHIIKNPVVEVDETISAPKLSLPIPDISLNLKPVPYLPSIPIPIINSQLISQLPLPLQSIQIPGLPLKTVRNFPMYIEEPLYTAGDFTISEVDVPVKTIPPPPQLPPLVLENILKPVIVEEKKIIFIPSPPEIQSVLPPTVVIRGRPCHPTACVQNILFERVLPNICESTSIELISIPATKRFPVLTTSLLPFMKK